jgi:DNA repair exonuclease SbcCD ATPase subunit
MRQISFQTKMEALELYLQGLSANEIVTKIGISKGAVISILKGAREGNFPGLELRDRIDELHNLSVKLRKEGLDLSQARSGFSFFERLLDMDIEPGKVKEWIEFCSEISPTPPEGFIPVAIELCQIEKETGKAYAEIVSEVKDLSSRKEKLISEVGNLEAKEIRAKELKYQIEDSQKEVNKLGTEKNTLEGAVSSLNSFLQERAEKLGISPDELEARFKELVSLEQEIANKRNEKNKLGGELEALGERQEKLSSRMEKASANFEKDIKLTKEMRNELIKIAEMKGKYEKEIESMEWARRILPFLSDPDKVRDDDFSLVSILVNCLDKWIQTQPEWRFRLYSISWDDVKRLVQSKRTGLG